jgi:hypothetical protein
MLLPMEVQPDIAETDAARRSPEASCCSLVKCMTMALDRIEKRGEFLREGTKGGL